LPGSREEPRTSPAKVVSVLVVEDSSIVRDRLVSMISEMPQVAIVGQAEEGFKAERMFDQLRPDAVILDIQLPGIHGMELLARFKKAHPACVVMVLTTYAFQEFRQRCMASGADHFFDKATEFERITQVLEAMQSRSSIHPPL
jgi:DNA-binding NarL/FixJ family response regulator